MFLKAPEISRCLRHSDPARRLEITPWLEDSLDENDSVRLHLGEQWFRDHKPVGHLQEHRGVMHFTVHGKGSKTHYVPVHPGTLHDINAYLEACGHAGDKRKPLYCARQEQPHRQTRQGRHGKRALKAGQAVRHKGRDHLERLLPPLPAGHGGHQCPRQ